MINVRGMKGCTHFMCNGCGKVKPIKQQHIVKASYTNFGSRSEEYLVFEIYYIQICDSCYTEVNLKVLSE